MARKSAHIIFLSLFRLLFLKNFGFLQVTKDKFCKVENKHWTHTKNLTRRALKHISKTADLVTADTPLGEPLGPASHADLLRVMLRVRQGLSRVPDGGGGFRDEPKERLLGRPMGRRLLFSFSEFRIQQIQRLWIHPFSGVPDIESFACNKVPTVDRSHSALSTNTRTLKFKSRLHNCVFRCRQS